MAPTESISSPDSVSSGYRFQASRKVYRRAAFIRACVSRTARSRCLLLIFITDVTQIF